MIADDAVLISDAFAAIGWDRPRELYRRYVSEADAEKRVCLVAERGGVFAGYGTLLWISDYPPFRRESTPEIVDLNVLPGYRRWGIGTALLDGLEAAAGTRSRTLGLGVGLHEGYGCMRAMAVRNGFTSAAATCPTGEELCTTTSVSSQGRPCLSMTPQI
jgi:GNAT superfamily N-acetyltransferase